MNYTEKYHLPQWEETDRIMRVDFNQMCADMEEGLSSNAQAAAELPYAVGSYTGNGTFPRDITLGFRPRFVIICSSQLAVVWERTGAGKVIAGPTVSSSRILMTDTGFQLTNGDAAYTFPVINANGTAYDYIAFK